MTDGISLWPNSRALRYDIITKTILADQILSIGRHEPSRPANAWLGDDPEGHRYVDEWTRQPKLQERRAQAGRILQSTMAVALATALDVFWFEAS